jgi:hypothetical protein
MTAGILSGTVRDAGFEPQREIETAENRKKAH